MPRDARGRNRKLKHNRDTKHEERELTQEEIDKIEKYAQGVNLEKEEQEELEHQKTINLKYQHRPMDFVRNYDIDDKDEG
jgi:hypothetical protein